MTKLLENAIEGLRELPADFQDRAAKQLMQYVEYVSDADEHNAIIEGRHAYERGEFSSLDQRRTEQADQ